jgi:hypothetical protein
VKRLGLLASVAVVYLLAAWMVAPGFYDGFTPQQPYNWVCPPPQAGSNQAPNSGHQVIKVVTGISDANSAFTDPDTQVVLGFNFGVFDSTGKTSITVDIKPVSPCPKTSGLTFATNTYLITADAPLVKKASLVMRFSDLVPAPSTVYYATSPDGPWTSIGALSQAQPFTIDTTIDKFGYYAAGYPSSAVSGRPGGSSQLLPIAIAVLIIVVILAGIPLAIIRRRRAPDHGEEEEIDDAEP